MVSDMLADAVLPWLRGPLLLPNIISAANGNVLMCISG